MKLSRFGEKFTRHSGIVGLMDDLGTALNDCPEMIFMGGGNPARLPEVEQVMGQCLQAVLADSRHRHQMFGIYQPPKGDTEFCRQLAKLLQREFDWPVTEKNIAVASGSQSAFFVLFNLFAGEMPDGTRKTIHLPLTPEYLGYADIGLSDSLFSASRPAIEKLDGGLFKYHVDFSGLQIDSSVGALTVSRPTNPTGNVLTDDEMAQLDQIASRHDIPFIIDGAYGLPFPGILFNQAAPLWSENTILVLSLSKFGLPGARTGIIVASEEVIEAYSHVNTIVSLACGNLGPGIARQLFSSGEILRLSREVVAPFYRQRAWQTVAWLRQALGDVPCHIHTPEGAIFLWLWFEGLPVSSQELYQRLKARGVLVVPGHHFFPGLTEDWQHRHECIRVSYAQDAGQVKQGVEMIADEVKSLYRQARGVGSAI